MVDTKEQQGRRRDRLQVRPSAKRATLVPPSGSDQRLLVEAAMQQNQEFTDREVPLAEPAQRAMEVNAISIATPDSLRLDVAGIMEVGDDLPRGALGDSDSLRNLEAGAFWPSADNGQDQSVIGEKAPRCQSRPTSQEGVQRQLQLLTAERDRVFPCAPMRVSCIMNRISWFGVHSSRGRGSPRASGQRSV